MRDDYDFENGVGGGRNNAFLASRTNLPNYGVPRITSPGSRPWEHTRPGTIAHRAAPRLVSHHSGALLLGWLLRCALIPAASSVGKGSESRHRTVHRMHAIRLSLPEKIIAQIGRHLRTQHLKAGRARGEHVRGEGEVVRVWHFNRLWVYRGVGVVVVAASRFGGAGHTCVGVLWVRGRRRLVAIRELPIGRMRWWVFSAYSSW